MLPFNFCSRLFFKQSNFDWTNIIMLRILSPFRWYTFVGGPSYTPEWQPDAKHFSLDLLSSEYDCRCFRICFLETYTYELLFFQSKIAKYAESGKNFEFFSNVSLCTFDIILRCAMSYQDDVQIKGYVSCAQWNVRPLIFYSCQDFKCWKK